MIGFTRAAHIVPTNNKLLVDHAVVQCLNNVVVLVDTLKDMDSQYSLSGRFFLDSTEVRRYRLSHFQD